MKSYWSPTRYFFQYRSSEILHSIKPSIFLSVDKGDHSLNEPRTQELVVGFNRPCFVQELFNKKDHNLEQIVIDICGRSQSEPSNTFSTLNSSDTLESIKFEIEKKLKNDIWAKPSQAGFLWPVPFLSTVVLVDLKFVGSSTQTAVEGSRCSTAVVAHQ